MSAYRVAVSWSDGAVVCIEAETADEAAKRAHTLIEEGRAHYPLDPLNASGFRVDEVQTLVKPDEAERGYMTENAEAWGEHQDEND